MHAGRILEHNVLLVEHLVYDPYLQGEAVSTYQVWTCFAVSFSVCVECVASSAADAALRR